MHYFSPPSWAHHQLHWKTNLYLWSSDDNVICMLTSIFQKYQYTILLLMEAYESFELSDVTSMNYITTSTTVWSIINLNRFFISVTSLQQKNSCYYNNHTKNKHNKERWVADLITLVRSLWCIVCMLQSQVMFPSTISISLLIKKIEKDILKYLNNSSPGYND